MRDDDSQSEEQEEKKEGEQKHPDEDALPEQEEKKEREEKHPEEPVDHEDETEELPGKRRKRRDRRHGRNSRASANDKNAENETSESDDSSDPLDRNENPFDPLMMSVSHRNRGPDNDDPDEDDENADDENEERDLAKKNRRRSKKDREAAQRFRADNQGKRHVRWKLRQQEKIRRWTIETEACVAELDANTVDRATDSPNNTASRSKRNPRARFPASDTELPSANQSDPDSGTPRRRKRRRGRRGGRRHRRRTQSDAEIDLRSEPEPRPSPSSPAPISDSPVCPLAPGACAHPHAFASFRKLGEHLRESHSNVRFDAVHAPPLHPSLSCCPRCNQVYLRSGLSTHQAYCKRPKRWNDDYRAALASLHCPPPVISSTARLSDSVAEYKRTLLREQDERLFGDVRTSLSPTDSSQSNPPPDRLGSDDLPGEPPEDEARLHWRPRPDAPTARELAQNGTRVTLDKVPLALRSAYTNGCRPFLVQFTTASFKEDVDGQIAAIGRLLSFQQQILRKGRGGKAVVKGRSVWRPQHAMQVRLNRYNCFSEDQRVRFLLGAEAHELGDIGDTSPSTAQQQHSKPLDSSLLVTTRTITRVKSILQSGHLGKAAHAAFQPPPHTANYV